MLGILGVFDCGVGGFAGMFVVSLVVCVVLLMIVVVLLVVMSHEKKKLVVTLSYELYIVNVPCRKASERDGAGAVEK